MTHHHTATGNPESRLENLERAVAEQALELSKLTSALHAQAEAIGNTVTGEPGAKTQTPRPPRTQR